MNRILWEASPYCRAHLYSAAAKEFYVDLAAPELSDVKIQAEGASEEEITEGSIKYLNTASKLKLTGKITESNGFEKSGLDVKIGSVWNFS